jgi:type I restriction enzyme M protein
MKVSLMDPENEIGMIYEILRATMNVSDVKNVVIPMMTLKYIGENDGHGFVIPESAEWNRVSSVGTQFGKRLYEAFQAFEEANTTLKGVFTNTHFMVNDQLSLFKVADSVLNRFSFRIEDQPDPNPFSGTIAQFVDRFWEFSISREGTRGGEISTPKEISMLMARLLGITDGDVYDGSSGICDSLIKAYQFAVQNGGHVSLYGQEISQQARALGVMNIILHGLSSEHAHIALGNTITNPKWIEENGQLKQFTGIITNPPFGLSNWGYEAAEKDPYGRFRYGIPGKSFGDMAFVLHALASLKPEGKAVIVVPHGVLFRGAGEGKIREALLREDFIEAVIGLPANLYLGTGIPVALLILNKKKPDSLKGKVLIINAEADFEKQSRIQNVLRDSDIDKIVDTYLLQKEIEQYSRLVAIDEIADQEYNLLPLRYFERAEITTTLGRVEINRKKYEQLQLVKLKDIAEISRGYGLAKEGDGEEFTHYLVNLSDVQDGEINPEGLTRVTLDLRKARDYELNPGDILLSSRGTALKVTVVRESDLRDKPLVSSQNFLRIRVNATSDPGFVKAFLESPLGQYYLEAFQKGTTVTVLSHKDVGEIPIPLPPLQKQQQIAEQMRRADQAYQEAVRAAKREHEQDYLEGYRMMGIADSFTLVK